MSRSTDINPLANALVKPQPAERSEALRRKIFADTKPVLQRRRLVRRFALAAVFVGCYLAGMANMRLWDAARTLPRSRLAYERSVNDRMPTPLRWRNEVSVARARRALQVVPESSTLTFQQLRDAGSDAWRKTRDLQSAVRFYAKALEAATPKDLAVPVVHDDWIWLSLKEAHLAETQYVEDHET